ncbi:cactus-binding C-terminus of cactin protein-domain-containing protein, partial [Catenaria anguillulae PL171]
SPSSSSSRRDKHRSSRERSRSRERDRSSRHDNESSRRDRDRDRGRSRSRSRSRDRRRSKRGHDDDKSRSRSRSRDRKKASKKDKKDPSSATALAAGTPSTSTSTYLLDDETSAVLHKPFVWGKKHKRDRKLGRPVEDYVDPSQFREELADLARRRAEREVERKLRDEERVQAQRDADRAQYGDWEAKEDEFQLRQAHARAQIRVKEARPMPVDLLAITLQVVKDPDGVLGQPGIYVDTREPYRMLEYLSVAELRDVLGDIEMYLWLEQDRDNVRFWKCLREVCEHELKRAVDGNKDRRVAPGVYGEIERSLVGKSYAQLVALQASVEAKLVGDEPIDVDYWEAMLELVKVGMAKATLREYQERMLAAQAEYRKRHGLGQATDRAGTLKDEGNKADAVGGGGASGEDGKADLTPEAFAAGTEDDADPTKQAAEVSLAAQTYKWEFKYRPRKPKYVNRVATGYEWNKYNQTHYDSDNPPPKVVQGYKFNIFYPDLLDKTKAPTYRLEPKPDGSKDTVILRFIAGPPYEDIAFEIINKEWEMSHTRGFKCVFERGVLQLHFHFKRFFYRK